MSLEGFSFPWRFKNAIYVYVAYLAKNAVSPKSRRLLSPSARQIELDRRRPLACGPLVAITAVAVACYRRFPFLSVGWFWYLGTLVPMIGLVQIGSQQMADRYTYFRSWEFFSPSRGWFPS